MGDFLERRYKTLLVLVKIYEIIGWIFTFTIILAFIGIPMILFAQTVLVQVSTEDNTKRTYLLLQQLVNSTRSSGVTNALDALARVEPERRTEIKSEPKPTKPTGNTVPSVVIPPPAGATTQDCNLIDSDQPKVVDVIKGACSNCQHFEYTSNFDQVQGFCNLKKSKTFSNQSCAGFERAG